MANPTNEGLVDNLLPIWTGRELEKYEIIEILEESEGDNKKGRIFMDTNKKQYYTQHKNPPWIWFPL